MPRKKLIEAGVNLTDCKTVLLVIPEKLTGAMAKSLEFLVSFKNLETIVVAHGQIAKEVIAEIKAGKYDRLLKFDCWTGIITNHKKLENFAKRQKRKKQP